MWTSLGDSLFSDWTHPFTGEPIKGLYYSGMDRKAIQGGVRGSIFIIICYSWNGGKAEVCGGKRSEEVEGLEATALLLFITAGMVVR